MRKWKLLFLFDILLSAVLFVVPAKGEENYSYIIVANKAANAVAPNAIYDLQYHLKKATGRDFKLINSDSAYTIGIRLVKLHPLKDTTFDKRLVRNNPDAFLIRSDGNNSLMIASYTSRGLANGIYTYLDRLGFRWFHPG